MTNFGPTHRPVSAFSIIFAIINYHRRIIYDIRDNNSQSKEIEAETCPLQQSCTPPPPNNCVITHAHSSRLTPCLLLLLLLHLLLGCSRKEELRASPHLVARLLCSHLSGGSCVSTRIHGSRQLVVHHAPSLTSTSATPSCCSSAPAFAGALGCFRG